MRIKKAEYVDGYKIKLLFNDGVCKIVDFEQFLSTTRKLLTPLSDLDYFKSFCLDEITICWADGLDFSPDRLYEVGKKVEEKRRVTPHNTRRKVSSTSKKPKVKIVAKSKN
jgi:hypothetical protein